MINYKKEIVKEKGITLIALIITVIILAILAGVTISFSRKDIGNSTESSQLSELGIIQNAVLQKKIKVDLTGETYPGQKITDLSINLDELIEDINYKKAFGEVSISRKDTNDENYYLISEANGACKELGIKNVEDEYIVNYETGEVINYTLRITANGKPLYIYAQSTN